jgi:hypothetical protein
MRLNKIVLLIAAFLVISAPVIPFIPLEKTCCHAGAAMNAGPAVTQGQQPSGQDAPAQSGQQENASAVLYRVMGVILIAWIGLALLLIKLDRRVAALEKETRQRG